MLTPPLADAKHDADDDEADHELEEAQRSHVAGIAVFPQIEHGDGQHDAVAGVGRMEELTSASP
jgi:hypothetical protein